MSEERREVHGRGDGTSTHTCRTMTPLAHYAHYAHYAQPRYRPCDDVKGNSAMWRARLIATVRAR